LTEIDTDTLLKSMLDTFQLDIFSTFTVTCQRGVVIFLELLRKIHANIQLAITHDEWETKTNQTCHLSCFANTNSLNYVNNQ